MSAAASIELAARGKLPAWAVVGPERRAHLSRVAGLLDRWAAALGLSAAERRRWRAAGWLHDALRDADPETLLDVVPPELRDLPRSLLHGPAAAERLRADGVEDRPLLDAIAFHTIGHPALDELGRALYLADFVEPGRHLAPAWLAALRARLPENRHAVLRQVVAARIGHLLDEGLPVRPESLAFWNRIVTP